MEVKDKIRKKRKSERLEQQRKEQQFHSPFAFWTFIWNDYGHIGEFHPQSNRGAKFLRDKLPSVWIWIARFLDKIDYRYGPFYEEKIYPFLFGRTLFYWNTGKGYGLVWRIIYLWGRIHFFLFYSWRNG